MHTVAPQPYRVERVISDVQMAALRGPWTEILAQTNNKSIFLTWEWMTTALRLRSQDAEGWVLTACNADGKVVGIAPFLLFHHEYGPFRLRRLAFIGSDVAYAAHHDILARPADQEAVGEAFLTYLEEEHRAWDALELNNLAADSVLRLYLPAYCPHYAEFPVDPAPFITLPASWEAYEQEYLSGQHRGALRKYQRRLDRDYPGQVVYQQVTQPAELSEAIDALIELSRGRWHERGLASAFERNSFTTFHRSLAETALEQGWLRLHQLKVAGETVAVEQCFSYAGVYYGYQRAFSLAWEKYSPGQLLFAFTLQKAIAEGAHKFDLLIGTHQSKTSWSHEQAVDLRVGGSHGAAGSVWSLSRALMQSATVLAREHLSDTMRARLQQSIARKLDEHR